MSCVHSCPHTVASTNDKWPSIFLLQELVSGHRCEMSIVSMNLLVLQIAASVAVMIQVNINSHHVDRLAMLDPIILYNLLISLKIRWLVHVQPHP